MKVRIYSREETDTFDEVNKVFNELRNEVVADFSRVDEDKDKLASITGTVFERIDERFAALEKRLAILEKPPKKPASKKPASKKSK